MSPAAPLLLLLAANGTSLLDCVCSRIGRGPKRISYGEKVVQRTYCQYIDSYPLYETCETLEPPSTVVPAVARLVPRSWSRGQPPPAEGDPRPAGTEGKGEGEGCDGALAAVRRLRNTTASELTRCLDSRIAADCIRACSLQGLNHTAWNVGTLTTDHLRRTVLSQLLHAVRRITKVMIIRDVLTGRLPWKLRDTNKTELLTEMKVYQEHASNYWREKAQLFSLGVKHISRLFVPLAFEHLDTHPNDQRLHRWIENMGRVADMLHTRLRGWVQDVQSISEQIANYKVEEDQKRPGRYIVRKPLLNHGLLFHHEVYLSFLDDFSAQCEEQQPKASQMFGLADAVYSFYREHWFKQGVYYSRRIPAHISIVDEEWRLEDKSSATLSVDTGCMQLLADALDHPTCPLEDLPPETIQQRQQCREQLWDDMVQRSPHIPITSYLAYTQRANVNLCLLAWMAVNSLGICQDVPFSVVQSVHDARCYFDSPDDQSCQQSNATYAICSVSRAILLLKCRDFSSSTPPELCVVKFYTNGSYTTTDNATWADTNYKWYGKPTERTLRYKDTLNSATLKYKDFKIDGLKPLEMSFIGLNIIFRILTAGVYVYLPQLRNLPGMIFLSFQITGIVQILCSEIVYRVAGVPDLSTMVLIDSALTLLSCIWLNSFCYQMYACIRHLRLPNDLLPAEARKVFCRQVLCVLITWTIVCTASIVMESTSKYFLLHSRIVYLTGISLSIIFNLVCLGLIGYMHLRTKKSMRKLSISSNTKFGSKKQLIYLSVKTVFLSGIGIIIRIAFHQVQDIAQIVYFVHIATMMQGPLLFVLFICNETALPVLKYRVLACWNPEIVSLGQELCSSAERNLAKRRNEEPLAAESSL
ncbi:uncharacterized protein LOC126213208 isoform X4 [Schistocerca nitens]|uniref:uncharacterized protein LOC126213208 isoform X4 n=1 Tax=Schistocerca nitens TaxID=7011 RepID=UPI0021179D17|nr:uncharacterized protein LOC126213208 isoform X4 [Schistocerca nitens]